MVTEKEIHRFVARFRRLAKEMENHLGPPEMAPGPDADDLTEAASYIEELHAALLASQSTPAPPEVGELVERLRPKMEDEWFVLTESELTEALEAAAALSSGWRSMESAPRKGNVLLDLGETIPGTPNARVGKFISEAEAATFHETLSSAGGWMIWNADDDWFVVPFADAVGWMPLPTPQGEQG